MSAHVRDRAWRLLVAAAPFLIAAVVYVGFAVRTDTSLEGDQPHYAIEAHSLARDLDRDLDDDYRDLALVGRVWSQPTLFPHASRYVEGGPLVSYHGVGLPLLLVPSVWVDGSPKAMEIEMALLAAFGAWLLFGILARLVPERPGLRWAVWAAVVFALPVLGYANQLFPDMPAAVTVLAAVRLLVEPRLRPRAIVAAAACAAFLPWLHVRFAVLSVVLAGAIVLRLAGQRRGRELVAGFAVAAAPLALSLVLFCVANDAWYGSPSPAASLHQPVNQLLVHGGETSSGSKASSESVFSFSAWVDADHVYAGLARSLFSARSGWLPFVPVATLGVACLIALVLRGNRWAWYGLAGALLYLVQVASTGTLPGYAIAGRFEMVLAPLVAIPLAVVCAQSRWVLAAFVPLAAVGVVAAVAARAHIGQLYPPADVRDKPRFALSRQLLALWPTVTRDQPPSVPSVTVGGNALHVGTEVRRVADATVVAPAGRAGLVVRAAPQSIPPGDQLLAVGMARDGAVDGRPVAGDVAVEIDGTTIAHETVTVAELPADGSGRGIPIPLRLAEGQRPVVVVRSTGAVRLRVGPVQFSSAVVANSGLGQRGTRYPDAGAVAVWALVLLGLGGAIALTLPRDRRLAATAGGPSVTSSA